MIAIKDMPMPKNCYECWFEDANQCYLNILQHIESLDRPEWCPLIEVAEPTKHGRWIPSDKGDCTYTCSECGFVRDAYILEEKAYCPRCGVKMFDKDIDVHDKSVGKMDEVEE